MQWLLSGVLITPSEYRASLTAAELNLTQNRRRVEQSLTTRTSEDTLRLDSASMATRVLTLRSDHVRDDCDRSSHHDGTVRRRLDVTRPVPLDVIWECIDIALQAPVGGGVEHWRWLVVTHPEQRKGIAELYRKAALEMFKANRDNAEDGRTRRIYGDAADLAERLEEVPVIVIPGSLGRPPVEPWGGRRVLRLDPAGGVELSARPPFARTRERMHHCRAVAGCRAEGAPRHPRRRHTVRDPARRVHRRRRLQAGATGTGGVGGVCRSLRQRARLTIDSAKAVCV